MQLLVSEGADVNMEDEDGDTAMHVALLRPQLANVMLGPATGTSSTPEESSEGCSSTSLYCRVRTDGEVTRCLRVVGSCSTGTSAADH